MGLNYLIYTHNSGFNFAGADWDKAMRDRSGGTNIGVVTYYAGGLNYVRFEKNSPWSGPEMGSINAILRDFVGAVQFVSSN
ncbi:uncharacterized protein I206_103578 [Kwoniella pini CBS 10737]|uniref:Uncharacterized protein n=1 Tax=Kwoniella pini CBS 10737 TaxID=1296096 RepID=A0A1B9I951_9TREE|nr:uncharacterized protein I206_01417 [Kwoniella pini CBS 10737]OCF52132.1 hypothetical protein I206_01417 [Kwoniella pini CBS 10737]